MRTSSVFSFSFSSCRGRHAQKDECCWTGLFNPVKHRLFVTRNGPV